MKRKDKQKKAVISLCLFLIPYSIVSKLLGLFSIPKETLGYHL